MRVRCVAQSVGSDFKKKIFPTPTEARAQARGEFFWRLAHVERGVCFVWSAGHVAMLRHCRLPRAPGRVTSGGRHETDWRHGGASLTTLRGAK